MKYTEEKDILLCYIVNAGGKFIQPKERMVKAAGYIKDGKPIDHMFDSFLFLCSPNYLYNYFPGGYALKELTKRDWMRFIIEEEFAPDTAIAALDTAVGEIKAQLGDPTYKANVFMSVFYPVSTVRSFGEVDGKDLDLSHVEDCKAALRWMVDESIRQFEARDFQNVRLAGFYWYCEELNVTDVDMGLTGYITEYVRSHGLKTCWCPFFGAPGHADWKELGFDITTEQANYFPEHQKNLPNRGTAERLALVAADVQKYGHGVGMEMVDAKPESAAVFKEYFKAGVEYGFMHKPHSYYMGAGPNTVEAIADSEDSYLRSTYDELYRYIHRTLTVEDIQ